MIRRPPRSTRTDTLFPYPTLFRSDGTFSSGVSQGLDQIECSAVEVVDEDIDGRRIQVAQIGSARIELITPTTFDEVMQHGLCAFDPADVRRRRAGVGPYLLENFAFDRPAHHPHEELAQTVCGQMITDPAPPHGKH